MESMSELTAEGYANDIKKVRDFVSKNKIPWMQATQESIEKLVKERFLVFAYPTEVLIGRDGKIITMEVRGDNLAKTLEKLLAEESAPRQAN
jgi:hypothetical protein